MKNLLFAFLFFISISLFAQYDVTHEFGKPLPQEIAMTVYDKDPTAKAVVLYEKGTYTFKEEYEHNLRYMKLFETRHKKVKILSDDVKGDYATHSIYIRGNNLDYEVVKSIKVATNNGGVQTFLDPSQIFTKPLSNDYYEVVFTFPNVQKGSILEYEYTITTSNYMRLNNWYFQDNIPTIYSEFYAEIPGFFTYTRTLIGNHPLLINNAELKKHCFYFNNNKNTAECEVLTYAMANVPALEKEEYTLSQKNYMNRLNFELERVIYQDGTRKLYAKDWKSVDQDFRSRKHIGLQLNNNSYFKNKLPENILSISNKLEKAKAVYSFIQNHYTWNKDSYSLFYENDIKKAYENKFGNAAEINFALINALNAAEIDTYLALSSTRENGLPTKDIAVIGDFNYAMAFVNINGQNYFLDASNKFYPFGTVPFHALNYDARIMDFKKGSFWETIIPNPVNTQAITVQLKVNEDYNLSGKLREAGIGLFAGLKREELSEINNDDYLRKKEASLIDLEIIANKISNKNDLDKPLIEDYDVLLSIEKSDNIIFKPFIFSRLSENPFKLKERSYPVDFGFSYKESYTLSLDLAGKYTIETLPENKAFALSDGVGSVSVSYTLTNDVLQMRYDFNLNHIHFLPESYQGLKDFFNHVVQIQNNHPVILKKI